jgi:hypothetical protein
MKRVMDDNLNQIKKEIYDKCGFVMSNLNYETESKEYKACRFELNGSPILCRNSKITPKKVGQFVTFWKRNKENIIEPFDANDTIDFCVINVRKDSLFGQFVIPKSVLIKKGIMTTKLKEGKRAFRVYPVWDKAQNKQAQQAQNWQLNYFFEICNNPDFKKVEKLYNLI